MPSNCKTCLGNIKKNACKLNCADCKQEHHANCVNMSQADIDYLNEQGTVWRCGPCANERRRSMRLETSMQEGQVSLQEVMQFLTEIRDEHRKTVSDFNKSYEVLHERLNESAVMLQDGLAKIGDYVRKIEDLTRENMELKNKVCGLENRVEELEQYSRRNCIEIQGVPEERAENVTEVIKKVGSALGMVIEDNMLDVCHRVGPKSEQRPRGIIVKFVRRMDKEKLLDKRRIKKRDFSTRHLGLAVDTPIYINESLSATRRRLLGQARQVKRERGYKYLWMRGGVILLRREDGAPVIEVKCQADLGKA